MDLSDLPQLVQRAYTASIHRTVAFYGEDLVDSQMTHDQVRLCEATADYVYSRYTPLELKYQRGQRPELEKLVARLTVGKTSERERALAVMRCVRDLYKGVPADRAQGASDLFHGGLEEEVIKKNSSMCCEQSRVFCVLCQVAGIPARYIGHYVGGHGVSEAYVEGAWAYFDNRGKYFVKPDGKLASAWDLIRDPSLIERQSPKMTAEFRPGYDYEPTRRYFAPVEVTVAINYFVWDWARFGYDWIWNTPALQERIRIVRKEFPEELSAANVLAMVRGERPWPT